MNISKCQNKKNLKKILKIKSRLTDKNGIIFSSEPTEIVIVANAGLGNDVKRHELKLSLISLNDHIKEVITPPNLTFAVIICKSCLSSEKFLTQFESFHICTPDFKLRPSVNAFCIYAKYLPITILSEIVDFDSSMPPGLVIIENLIETDKEEELVKYFLNMEYNIKNNENLKQRTVMHFGFKFNYTDNRVDFSQPLLDHPIPQCCLDILLKLEQKTGKFYSNFNQLTVNIYRPGDGIPPHIDTHSIFGDEIISVSLNSDVVMEFINIEHRNVDLRARSVCIMAGESRYLWQHGIAARKSDLIFHSNENQYEKRQRQLRISLTFRQVLAVPDCRCPWPQLCDFQSTEKFSDFHPFHPGQLEQQFVHEVYDNIASHFSSTRHSMWPKVRQFIERHPSGSIGADIGCGNGKYFPAILSRGYLLASDSSLNLVKIAMDTHKIDPIQSNCLQLPYRDSCCDYFICIAVLHHLSTAERRKDAMEKMTRILRPGGQGLIYVWAQEQENDGVKSKYLNKKPGSFAPIVRATNGYQNSTPLPVHMNRTQFTKTDMLVPWSKKSQGKTGSESSEVFTRYYHLFQQGELENLCSSVLRLKIVESWHDSGNWATVIERL